MKTPTMRHGWHRIRSTSCWSVGIPSRARIWLRNLPCRVLKMLRIARNSFRMTEALADCVIERHCKRLQGRARRITIDLDPTDDPTHGQQQFTFFNSNYDSYCYLPMVCFLT